MPDVSGMRTEESDTCDLRSRPALDVHPARADMIGSDLAFSESGGGRERASLLNS